ncbi:hypothetical protein [Streptomyces sp. NPDC002187]|uniref:hypothetical protein n=1 Tax=Streptomyces sp. NPDC002187 TaxID=3364637 RepID=UPI0036895D45
MPGTAETDDKFGSALDVTDLKSDGIAHIVVGCPGEAIGTKTYAGAVTVIPGRRTGKPGTGAYTITQDTQNVPGSSESGDEFGSSLAAGDVNKNGRPELIIGGYGDDGYRGAVWALPGTTSGPTHRLRREHRNPTRPQGRLHLPRRRDHPLTHCVS